MRILRTLWNISTITDRLWISYIIMQYASATVTRLHFNYLYGCTRESHFFTESEKFFWFLSSLLVLACTMLIFFLFFFSIPIYNIVRLLIRICTVLILALFFSRLLSILIFEHLHMVPSNIRVDAGNTKNIRSDMTLFLILLK